MTLLTPFTAFLEARAPAVHYSARILFQELRAQQYTGSYETIRRFVQPLRTAAAAAEGTQRRFQTAPGQQSQIDWAPALVPFRRGGPRMRPFFVLTLGYCRRSSYAAYVGETLGQFLDAHERAFAYFGGCIREHLNRLACQVGDHEAHPSQDRARPSALRHRRRGRSSRRRYHAGRAPRDRRSQSAPRPSSPRRRPDQRPS